MTAQIMVVDDDSGLRTLFGIMLERGGYNLLAATSGRTALAMLECTTPDLIVMDVSMTDIDGLELCARLRTRPQTARTPIIMVAPVCDYETVRSVLEAGANDYLSMPFLPEDLLGKVRHALSTGWET